MPSAGESSVPSSRVIFWVALWVSKQYWGLPFMQARHWPQIARQFRITRSPTADFCDFVADSGDATGGLVAEQERKLVVDPALLIVEVGVADTARDDVDDSLAGTGIRNDHRLDLRRSTLGLSRPYLGLL